MTRCVILDDKLLGIDILTDYLAKIPFIELVNSFTDPFTALEFVKENSIDLIFLDIQMPEMTGIQFMKILNAKCKVILVTAYSDYALEGYEHEVIDYLLKPVSFERFYKAIEKAKLQWEITATSKKQKLHESSVNHKDVQSIFVKTEYKIVRVSLNSILYIEAKQNYITIATYDKPVMSLQSIKNIEEELPKNRFIRIHRSYIVAIDKIDSIEKSRIYIGKITLPIGENYRDTLIKRIRSKS